MIFEEMELIFDVLKLIWEQFKAQIYIYINGIFVKKWHLQYMLAI